MTQQIGARPLGHRQNRVGRSSSMSIEHAKGRFIATKLGAYALSRAGLPTRRKILKALSFIMLAALGAGSAIAQDPPAVVDHRAAHVQTVTHNDGKAHKQVTNYRHRTIIKTPHGTLVHTETKTTTTTPK